MFFFDVAWTGIGLRFAIATDTDTALVLFTTLALEEVLGFRLHIGTPFWWSFLAGLTLIVVAPVFFRLADRFSHIYCPLSKLKMLSMLIWFLISVCWFDFREVAKNASLMIGKPFWDVNEASQYVGFGRTYLPVEIRLSFQVHSFVCTWFIFDITILKD